MESPKIQNGGHDVEFSGKEQASSALSTVNGLNMYRMSNCSDQYLKQLKTMPVYNDDVWLISYPKSGQTWLCGIILALQRGADQLINEDFLFAKELHYPEFNMPGQGMDAIASSAQPRLIKTHLPLKHLPTGVRSEKPKIIYIARNVKDVCVSSYHFYQSLGMHDFDFNQYFSNFKKGNVMYNSWLDHVTEYWTDFKDSCLFITYEELKKNPARVIRRIADYLNVPLTEEQLAKVQEMTSFESMKKCPNFDLDLAFKMMSQTEKNVSFYRKGIVGDWKNHFTAEMSSEFEEEFLKPVEAMGLKFDGH